ncbi:hypothetical protein fHeYen901_263 [Yersinia phage fHe-Yen9-01]|uniref:Late transcription coactivator n=1 Tax=Yersinia phage fHe-Yen9-01 TaxID=1965363 RepID=A0A1V0DXZ5_9CAUD|nr:late promoter transcriptional regulator [Yersinia phage fHe-Yen9-01]ARB06036.1 hypothetical protein fHeYen901_263 [Yersinia phage fHe-Yen9-01]
MTQSSISNFDVIQVVNVESLADKQQAGFEIEQIVASTEATYLEATSQWLQENSLHESQINRYIPQVIIDKIKDQAIEDNLLRPSMSRLEKTNTLDFMML